MRGTLRHLPEALAAATERLLSERTACGHWEGRLSSSALSTATAAFALAAAGEPSDARLVERALDWVAAGQNADGGWGDTAVSGSNLSTTALCRAALTVGGGRHGAVLERAEAYLRAAAGSPEPAAQAAAVAGRYGEDRTFSVPILTMCALAGLLGPEPGAWRHVAQLPFEFAACPHGLLRLLGVPVVSYGLPALIAIGALRHARRPTRNVLLRALRRAVLPRVGRLLERIQPPSGGFLEAAPLTSFVLMSLAAMARPEACWASAARRCTGFLRATVRPDGSWPIDTNLATWVTTLSINALPRPALERLDAPSLRRWLLAQHHTVEHPYTRAAPGGWAWTDLPGGVPDADDTAGALRALARLGPDDPAAMEAAAAGCGWLAGLQNADGGIPTFCRGWGRLPFDRSCADLTAHALAAWAAWRPRLGPAAGRRLGGAMRRACGYLARCRRGDGAWVPLWFGNERAEGQANPVFGTARAVAALRRAGPDVHRALAAPLRDAAAYLLAAQRPDGAWGGEAGVEPSIEETAAAVAALADCLEGDFCGQVGLEAAGVAAAAAAGAEWLVERTACGRDFPAAPIGLYFAKLWYFERLYPIVFVVEALGRVAKARPG